MARRRSNGEGSIFWSEAQKLWAAELVLPDGKPKRKRSKKQSVVREWLEKEKEAVRGGTWVSGESMRVGDFMDRFLDEVATHTLRPATYVNYGHQIKNHIKPHLGELKITNLRPDHLQRMYSVLLKKGLSKATVRKVHSVLRRALGVALEWGLVGRNVAEAVKPPPPEPPEIKPLTIDEARHLLKVLEADRLYAYYALLITTGIRRGEGLALHKEDLDLDRGTVTIKRSISFIPHMGLVLGEAKNVRSNRTLALPEFTINALREHLLKYPNNSKYVFATGNDTPFSPRNVHTYFKENLDKAGLPQTVRLHDLRHSYLSWLVRSGVDIRSVSGVAGHTQLSTTQRYVWTLPGYNKEVSNKVEGMYPVTE